MRLDRIYNFYGTRVRQAFKSQSLTFKKINESRSSHWKHKIETTSSKLGASRLNKEQKWRLFPLTLIPYEGSHVRISIGLGFAAASASRSTSRAAKFRPRSSAQRWSRTGPRWMPTEVFYSDHRRPLFFSAANGGSKGRWMEKPRRPTCATGFRGRRGSFLFPGLWFFFSRKKICWSTKCGKRSQIEISVRRMVVVAQAVEWRYSIREGRVWIPRRTWLFFKCHHSDLTGCRAFSKKPVIEWRMPSFFFPFCYRHLWKRL